MLLENYSPCRVNLPARKEPPQRDDLRSSGSFAHGHILPGSRFLRNLRTWLFLGITHKQREHQNVGRAAAGEKEQNWITQTRGKRRAPGQQELQGFPNCRPCPCQVTPAENPALVGIREHHIPAPELKGTDDPPAKRSVCH